MTELPVRTEADVKVVLQIKDIAVFVLRASPQLTVKKVFGAKWLEWSMVDFTFFQFFS